MLFKTFLPASDLLGEIRSYYTVEIGDAEAPVTLTDHPHGNIGLMLSLKGGFKFGVANKTMAWCDDIVALGQQEQFFRHYFMPGSLILGVLFKPEGFGRYFGVPTTAVANAGISLVHGMGAGFAHTLDSLYEAQCLEEMVGALEHYLIQKRHKTQTYDNQQVAYVANRIRQLNGLVSVNVLAQEANMGLRTLQRKYKQATGISPKRAIKIARFLHCLKLLKSGKVDIYGAMAICKYYDQNHLIKEFKQFTGATPTKFLAQDVQLSDFFMKIAPNC